MEYPILRVNRSDIRKFSSERTAPDVPKYFDDGDFRRGFHYRFIGESLPVIGCYEGEAQLESLQMVPALRATIVDVEWDPFFIAST